MSVLNDSSSMAILENFLQAIASNLQGSDSVSNVVHTQA